MKSTPFGALFTRKQNTLSSSKTTFPQLHILKKPSSFFSSISTSRKVAVQPQLLKGRTCFISNCEKAHGNCDLPSQVAISLSKYGASVIAHGTDKTYLQDLESAFIVHHNQQKHATVIGDLHQTLNNGKSLEIVSKVQETTDKLDILIHNAGTIFPPSTTPTEIDLMEFDKLVRFNLTTPFGLVKFFLPLLEKGDHPSIILSSTEVLHTSGSHTNGNLEISYYISKFGFRSSGMITKMLANEFESKKIRVNSIDPGRVFQFRVPEIIPEGADRTVPYVWLSRADTHLTGAQLDVKDWINRDPKLYNYYY